MDLLSQLIGCQWYGSLNYHLQKLLRVFVLVHLGALSSIHYAALDSATLDASSGSRSGHPRARCHGSCPPVAGGEALPLAVSAQDWYVPDALSGCTPQLPCKTAQIPSNRDHKALDRGTLGGLGGCLGMKYVCSFFREPALSYLATPHRQSYHAPRKTEVHPPTTVMKTLAARP